MKNSVLPLYSPSTGPQQRGFRLLDLPREIQDQIIGYVLGPREVRLEPYTKRWGFMVPECQRFFMDMYNRIEKRPKDSTLERARRIDHRRLRFPDPRFSNIGGRPSRQQPGFQLLATCKALYEAGHVLFYSRNVFHLAPGPIVISSHYFEQLQPRHRNLIKFLILEFTIADLTPEGFQHVEEEVALWKRTSRRSFRHADKAQQVRVWLDSSIATLNFLWRRKLEWLEKWQTLERAWIYGGRYKMIVKGEKTKTLISNMEPWDALPLFWKYCEIVARKQLKQRYEKCGMVFDGVVFPKAILDVEPVKDWLSKLSPRLRYKF